MRVEMAHESTGGGLTLHLGVDHTVAIKEAALTHFLSLPVYVSGRYWLELAEQVSRLLVRLTRSDEWAIGKELLDLVNSTHQKTEPLTNGDVRRVLNKIEDFAEKSFVPWPQPWICLICMRPSRRYWPTATRVARDLRLSCRMRILRGP